MTATSNRRQPAHVRLTTPLFKLKCAIGALMVFHHVARATPTFAADTPKMATMFDPSKIGEIEILAGTGITVADLGDLAPLALDLLARRIPRLALLRELLKAALAIKEKIDDKAQRADAIARMKAIEVLLGKIGTAMAEESGRLAAEFEALRADNRKTHAELTESNQKLEDMRQMLTSVAQTNSAAAAALNVIIAKLGQSPSALRTVPSRSPRVVISPAKEPRFGQTEWAIETQHQWLNGVVNSR